MKVRTLVVVWFAFAIAVVAARLQWPAHREGLGTLYPVVTLLLVVVFALPRQSRILQQVYEVDRELWLRLTGTKATGSVGVNSFAMLSWSNQPESSIPYALRESWRELRGARWVGPVWLLTTAAIAIAVSL